MLFRGSVQSVGKSSIEKSFVDNLIERFSYRHGHFPSDGEVRSWERSIPILVSDLADAGLNNIELLIEFNLPFTSKRVDVVLAGQHKSSLKPLYVFVELKQWSIAQIVPNDTNLVEIPAYRNRPVLHPQAQVEDYAEYASNYLKILQGDVSMVHGLAYLHNAKNSDIETLRVRPESETGRLFTGQDRGELIKYFQSVFSDVEGASSADLLLSSAVGASTQLMKVAAEEIRNREMFVLLDEQRIAYQIVLNALEKSRHSDTKEVVIVTGGPGSGKSAIALQLLGELNRRGFTAFHVTGSKSFTSTLRKVAGKGSSSTKDLFKYFRDMAKATKNSVDVLLADEAHRVRETSTNRFTRPIDRTGKAQLEELIDCARVPVFLLDENQVVRPDEVGTIEAIRSMAEKKNLPVTEISLSAQFRCGGSRGYEDWVDDLLGFGSNHVRGWQPDDRFTVECFESPEALEEWVQIHSKYGDSSRMTAGFCWSWSEPSGETLVDDVIIGQWKRPWNAKTERALKNAPASSYWATDELGIGQVGCVYTAQGFEFDWNGVIIGPDLVWRNGKLVTIPANSRDPVIKKKSLSPSEADKLIRNTYKVLLTRGMKGTAIYAVDSELRKLLKTLVHPQK